MAWSGQAAADVAGQLEQHVRRRRSHCSAIPDEHSCWLRSQVHNESDASGFPRGTEGTVCDEQIRSIRDHAERACPRVGIDRANQVRILPLRAFIVAMQKVLGLLAVESHDWGLDEVVVKGDIEPSEWDFVYVSLGKGFTI